MSNFTPEQISEQQERLAAIEIALEKQERRLRRMRRLYRQEAEHYERMVAENEKAPVFRAET